MTDWRQFHPLGSPIKHPRLAYGFVDTARPAPSSFSSPLWVTVQQVAQDRVFGPFYNWPAIHGATLPTAGTPVVVGFDEQDQPYVLWWGHPGTTAQPPANDYAAPSPGGAAGGVLSGTYPNPGMAAGAAATNVGALGGELAGTLPNPSITRLDLQAGVLGTAGSTGYSGVGVNSSTGAITFTPAADTVWIGVPLIRGEVAATQQTVTPSVLPTSGNYVAVAVEMTAPASGDGNVGWTTTSGTNQTSQANALANPAALNTTRVRLMDVIIQNSAGSYVLSTTRDRRPWARGGYYQAAPGATTFTTTTAYTQIGGSPVVRLECSGVPIEFVFPTFEYQLTSAPSYNSLFAIDVDSGASDVVAAIGGINGTGGQNQQLTVSPGVTVTPAAGSHLFKFVQRLDAGGAGISPVNTAGIYIVREIVRQNANNGTS